MPSATTFLAFGLVAFGMVLTPGPNMIYLVSRSIGQGRRAGLISLAGVALGFLVYLLAVSAGIATVFALVPEIYLAVKLAGAGYLLWLAWKAVRPGGRSPVVNQELTHDKPLKLFLMGLLTCLLNPKVAILYISLLPQFVDPERGHVALQGLLLGLTQIAVGVAGNAFFIVTAGSVAGFFARHPLWQRLHRYVMGTALAGFAVRIATERTGAPLRVLGFGLFPHLRVRRTRGMAGPPPSVGDDGPDVGLHVRVEGAVVMGDADGVERHRIGGHPRRNGAGVPCHRLVGVGRRSVVNAVLVRPDGGVADIDHQVVGNKGEVLDQYRVLGRHGQPPSSRPPLAGYEVRTLHGVRVLCPGSPRRTLHHSNQPLCRGN